MPEQLFKIDNKAVPIDEMVDAGKLLAGLMQSNVLVPVEAYEKREVCICLMSEGFDPQPPQRIHNNWCTYVEQTDDA